MPKIKFLNYNLEPNSVGSAGADQQPVVNVDFASGDVQLPANLAKFILSDWQSFTVDPVGKAYSTKLSLDIDGANVVVDRNWQVKSVSINPPGITEWQNRFVLVPPEWGADVLKQLKFLINTFGQPVAAAAAAAGDIHGQIKSLGGEKILEIEDKIYELEEKLASQKQKDEQTVGLGELENAYTAIDEEMKSVQSLLQKQLQVNETLARYGVLLQQDLEQQSVEIRRQLDQIRNEELVKAAEDAKFTSPLGSGSEDLPQPDTQAKFVGIMGIALLAIGVLGFLFTQNLSLLLLSLFSGVLEVAIFFLINRIPAQIDIGEIVHIDDAVVVGNIPGAVVQGTRDQQVREMGVSTAVTGISETEKPKQSGLLLRLEKFFIDKAWITALREEVQNINKMISERLGGKELSDLQLEQRNLQANINNLKAKIEEFKTQELSPEDYLKARRELDMLNIDKARAERDLREQPDSEKLFELLAMAMQQRIRPAFVKLANLGVPASNTDEPSWQAVGVDAADEIFVQFSDGNALPSSTLSDQQLYLLIVLLKAAEWRQAPDSPMVIVDPLTPLEDKDKLVLENLITDLRTIGQLIRVSLS